MSTRARVQRATRAEEGRSLCVCFILLARLRACVQFRVCAVARLCGCAYERVRVRKRARGCVHVRFFLRFFTELGVSLKGFLSGR